jgi:maltose O-acetyltransferase
VSAPVVRTDRSSVPAQIRRFFETMSPGRALRLWAEHWLVALLRPIPSLVGFGLRYLCYRALFGRLDGFCFIYPGAHFEHTYGMRVGRNLHVNGGTFFDGRGGLTIGSNVLVGPNAVLLSSQHHWSDPSLPIVVQGHRLAHTVIGDDVWIGANAVIMPGVHVADGTVIGAGSVVTSDTSPYTIVAGVPARQIGERPSPR